jgi:hypothetical protein
VSYLFHLIWNYRKCRPQDQEAKYVVVIDSKVVVKQLKGGVLRLFVAKLRPL